MSTSADCSVFITGASGFIGKRVAALMQDQGYKITLLSRRGAIAALPEADTISNVEHCNGADYIIHIAHDHYNGDANKRLWEELEALADRVGTKGIVLFSSIAVHPPDFRGVVTEAEPYARSGDDYVATKIWLEKKAKAWVVRKPASSLWILRPTTVVGLGGNWTAHGLDVAKKKRAYLPFGGKNPCCVIHVEDVAEATLSAVKSLSNFSGAKASIISGSDQITWSKFYEIHRTLYEQNSGKKSTLNIESVQVDRKYHDNSLKNFFYIVLFDSIFSPALRPLLGILRQVIRRRRACRREADETQVSDSWTPQGMSRIFHSSQFTTRHNLPNWAPRVPIDAIACRNGKN